jgi:hypothetical protein
VVLGVLIAALYVVVPIIVVGVAALGAPVAAALVYAVPLAPLTVFFSPPYTVTYAEPRYHENPAIHTAALAAQPTQA